MKLRFRIVHRILLALFISAAASIFAKDQPAQVITWPESGALILRFNFGKFKEIGGVGSQHTYVTDTVAENLWSKSIPDATFTLYLYDKNKTRVGEGFITLSNVGPGQTVRFQTTIQSSGSPVSISLIARSIPRELGPAVPERQISLTINSVPQGAEVKIDGVDAGATPKIAKLTVGKHSLQFSKEGFNTGTFPVDIGADDASGGSISYELGTSAHDTVELRDGTVLTGDLLSVDANEIDIRVGGAAQHFDRNQVKRILLVERDRP